MLIYSIVLAVIGLVAGILLAVRSKKAEGVVYNKLDQAGRIINVLLIAVFVRLTPVYLFLGAFCSPAHDGFLGFLGWVVSWIISSASIFCGLGLGFSVALRKQGKSKLSFAVQFAGLVSIVISVGLYLLFAGNLLISMT